jgi:phosphoglycolate phosphatase-like HAD superfamily hydrolase
VFPVEQVRRCAEALYKQSGKPVCVTRGERGMLVVDAEGVHAVPGIHLVKSLDPVGAGDTATSALALSLAAGVKAPEAAEFANYAAAVTVQKLFRTGTACPEEILQLAADPDFIYQPELAEDVRRARYWRDTHIELCYPADQIPRAKVEHALFDFDGTVSVLREGWEPVMEQVMVRAILGGQYEKAEENPFRQVRERVREYISKSTGIQTILQMEHLVELVREFGVVPEDQVKDKHAYKRVYDQALMPMVDDRIERLQRGELNVPDVSIKGAVELLRSLAGKGVRLYLASGTDREHVEREASALGVAQLFSGGIYGAVGDVSRYSKKMVIEEIIRDNNLAGPELVVCGDGPVELRECRKNGGLAVGVASDEVRRYGLNRQKRIRLIKAGAHLIVPDFSSPGVLLDFLFERT